MAVPAFTQGRSSATNQHGFGAQPLGCNEQGKIPPLLSPLVTQSSV